jgi:CBS domain-containing protein
MKARDIMGTPPIIVSSDMPLVKAGSLMILRRVKQLPVVDNERLSGIVTLTDIVKYFGEKVK